MAARYDRILLSQSVCRIPKVRRLEDGEFRAFIAALGLAGQSSVRGWLVSAPGIPLTTAEIADEARVAPEVAASMVEKMLEAGTLTLDGRTGALRFNNWERFNPPPRASESREAQRQRKAKQRHRDKLRKAEQAAEANPEPPPGWQPIADKIRAQIGESAFALYVGRLKVEALDDGYLELTHPDGNQVTWVRRRYQSVIEQAADPRQVSIRKAGN